MKYPLLVGAAMSLALTSFAFAENATNPAPNTDAAAPPAKMINGKTADANGHIQDTLMSSLKQAGFTDVTIKPGSFVVEAKDKSGNPVTMVLGPNSFAEVTDVNMSNSGKSASNAMPADGMFANVASQEDLTSKVVGLSITNTAGQSLGTIKDVAFDNGRVKAFIVGVGGFVGLGDHYVAVRPSAVNLNYDSNDKKWRATMNATEAQLKSAPEFKYPS